MFNVSEFSFKRFISTVGIDFREKKITWRGQKNETLEKSVRTSSPLLSINLIPHFPGTQPAHPAPALGHSRPGALPQSDNCLFQEKQDLKILLSCSDLE